MFRMRTLLFMLSIVPLVEASGRRCSYFNGTRMPCSQLNRARKFNEKKMPKLRAAGYDRVRSAMTEYGLFGKYADVNWDVGHACPDPDKNTKTDDEDYGWNLFAHASSDNKRLGHCLVSCAEAAHFRATVPCTKKKGCRKCTTAEIARHRTELR